MALAPIPLRGSAVAAFEFFAAAARAQFVATNFRLIALNRLRRFLVVFVRMELLHAAAGAGSWAEELLYGLPMRRAADG